MISRRRSTSYSSVVHSCYKHCNKHCILPLRPLPVYLQYEHLFQRSPSVLQPIDKSGAYLPLAIAQSLEKPLPEVPDEAYNQDCSEHQYILLNRCAFKKGQATYDDRRTSRPSQNQGRCKRRPKPPRTIDSVRLSWCSWDSVAIGLVRRCWGGWLREMFVIWLQKSSCAWSSL